MLTNRKLKKMLGFTLMELLAVVCIIGIASAAVVWTGGKHNEPRQLAAFAEQFKTQLQVVREESLLQMKIFGLMIKDDGFQFCQYSDKPEKRWGPIASRDAFWRKTKITSGIKIAYSVGKSKIKLEAAATAGCQPQIFFFPSGEISEFKLTVSNKNVGRQFYIVGAADGNISLEEPR